MTRTIRFIATSALLAALAVLASASMSAQGKPAAGPAAAQAPSARADQNWAAAPSSERTYKVKLDFNRWHDVDGTPGRHADAGEGVPEVPQVHLTREDRTAGATSPR